MIRRTFKNIELFILFLIFLFALAIRIVNLDQSPSGMLVDEVSFGYNAYSILKTGKDEHGVSYPLVFKAFGDQKLPGLVYATVPFVSLFGLTNTAVRLPSALSGAFLVVVMYYILINLKISKKISLIGALITAVSPWTFILSRFGFESNVALLVFALGILFTIRLIKKPSVLSIVLSGFFFASTWYFYVAYRVITVLFVFSVLLLMFVQKNKIVFSKKSLKIFFTLAVTFFIVSLPLLSLSFGDQGTARLKQIGIFSDQGIDAYVQEQQNFCFKHIPSRVCRIIWNKPTVITETIVRRYVASYAPSFLFLTGDKELPYLNVSGYGQFYLILLPFFILGGIYVVMTDTLDTKTKWMILLGLLISPLPAALAGDAQKVRLSAMVPFMIILITYGCEYLYKLMRTKKNTLLHLSMFAVVSIIFLFQTGSFLSDYFFVHVDKNDFAYDTHVMKLFEYLNKQDKRVTINIDPSFSDPIMYYAYTAKIDPTHYQKDTVYQQVEDSGFQHAISLDNMRVTNEDYRGKACTLFVTHRNLGLGKNAVRQTIQTTNGVHTLFFVYSLDAPIWCKELQTQ